jgi:beta-glucanase (GH16 family)
MTSRSHHHRSGWLVAAAVAIGLLATACAADDGETTDQATADGAADQATADGSADESAEPSATEDPSPEQELKMAAPAPEPLPIETPEGWELVWHDEFDGDHIDTTSWTYDIGGWGWGNGEAQYYTDRPENARVMDGVLVIEARQEQFEDSYFTSARMLTQGLRTFQYGRIEARILVPKGAGLWPAFWMLGADFAEDAPAEENRWPNVGEIDIMEYVGREPDLVLGTLHGPGYAGAGGLTRWNRQDFDIGDDWRTFAIEWDETGITWFFEGEPYYTLTPDDLNGREWVFDGEFFLILNLAIGGTLGGPIALDLEFPQQLLVDHVRVWQRTDAAAQS